MFDPEMPSAVPDPLVYSYLLAGEFHFALCEPEIVVLSQYHVVTGSVCEL